MNNVALVSLLIERKYENQNKKTIKTLLYLYVDRVIEFAGENNDLDVIPSI